MNYNPETQLLKVVDAFDLDDELRSLLRPGEMVRDEQGRRHRLPRYFYEIENHETAVTLRLTPHFGLNEFILVELKEAPRLQQFPRYVPCAAQHCPRVTRAEKSKAPKACHAYLERLRPETN